MKGKLSFMWRATLALVLVLSLGVVMAAPVAAAVSQPEVTFATDDQAAPGEVDAEYTIEFVSGVALATTDTITIEFPTGTTLGSIAGTVETETIVTTTVLGQRVRITVPASADIIAGETVDVVLTGGITNPADGDYELKVYTSEEPTAVTSETYVISEAVTNVNQPTLTPTTVGATATYAIPFTTIVALRTSDAIVIEFPVDTDISAVVAGDVTGVTVASTSVVGQVLTITLGGNLGAGTQTVTIANHIINPTTLLNPDPLTNEWKLTVYTTYGHRIPVESAAYSITDPATAISQVAWLTVDDYIANNTASTAFVIQTQTGYETAKTVAATTTFTLTASSGAFYSNAGCTTVITTIDIGSAAHTSAAFYYKGATATVGTVTITADEVVSQGWTMASTTILVNPKLELWGGGVKVGEYKTFALAMAVALPDDTIKFAPSTYDGFTVNKPDLTIESTAGKATTIIEGCIHLTADADNFVLGGTAGKGFTLQESAVLIDVQNPTDVEISYNTLDTGQGTFSRAIHFSAAGATGLTVTENAFLITDQYDQGIRNDYGSTGLVGLTVSNNTFTGVDNTLETSAIEICSLDIQATASTFSGNTMTSVGNGVVIGSDQGGGLLCHATTSAPLTISSNTFSGCNYGIDLVNATATGVDQDIVITQNTFSDNDYGFAIDYGVYPATTDNWEPEDFTVDYNDFSGNTYAVYNNVATNVTAENNYWGSATGPTITANVGGIGDRVSTYVDYTPWLNASGGGPLTTTVITLQTDWNLISLPLIPVDSDIDTVLAGAGTGVTVNKVAYYTGGPAGSWLYYNPPPAPSDLTTMNDGKGYWIDVIAGGSLTITGVELALPGQVPPTYDVVVGWNLIGFTSTGVKTVNVYLGSAVVTSLEAIYEYSAGAYTIPTDFAVGKGYWLAVNTAGKIYP